MNIHLQKTVLIITTTLFYNLSYSINLRQISNVENLSNSSIESLFQDKNGTLWIGTCDGLNVYNGKRTYVFQTGDNSKALSGNIINKIIETDSNTLWIQTFFGLNKLDKQANSLKYYHGFKQSLHMAKDKYNTLFIVQDDNLIQYYDSQNDIFKLIYVPGIKIDNILEFVVDKDNKLWIFYKDGEMNSYSIIYAEDTISFKENFRVTHSRGVLYYFYTNNDILIIDKHYQLYSYNLHSKSLDFLFDLKEEIEHRGEVSSIVVDNQSIFIGYKTNGVQILHKKVNGIGYEIENLPINCGVFSLFKDRYQDIVWIGTDGQGVYLCSNDMYTFRSTLIKDYIPQIGKPVRFLYEDKQNTFWIGTKGDGIVKIYNYDSTSDLSKNRIERVTTENSELHDNSTYCISESKKDILWIGTEYGLNYYSYHENKVRKIDLYDDIQEIIYIHDIYEQDSVLWLATVGLGMVKADLKWDGNRPILSNIQRKTINNAEFASNYFFSIFVEDESTIWFANRGHGAFKVNTNSFEYERITFSDRDSNKTLDQIFCITKHNNKMYFGSSAGLIEYESNNKFNIIDNTYGIPNNTIHGIIKDNSDNSLWLSTNKGVTNYNPSKGSIRNYGIEDGLAVTEFSDDAVFKNKEGNYIFMGGVNGFISIYKNWMHENNYTPEITFDGLSIYGKSENINDFLVKREDQLFLELKSTQNFFAIEVNAIDFLDANNYSFQYQIEGLNSQWVENGNSNIISLTNLDHGKYTLKVRYINRVTGKKSPEYTLAINILPAWYASDIAYAIYMILLLCSIFLFFKYIDFKEKKKKRRFIRVLEAKHKEEVYESKLSFFTSIAHEFCTPLTLIYGPCNQILDDQNANPTVKKYAQVILKNAQRLNSLIQDLIEFRKIETDNKPPIIENLDIVEIADNIIASFKELAYANNVKFYKSLPNELKWNSDRSYLITIITNLLSNAFKYMSEAGCVEIGVTSTEHNLIIKISNTGKGIKEVNLEKIFDRHLILDTLENKASTRLWSRNGLGLAISNSMVKNLKGKIDVESIPNEWTHFIVTLPWHELNNQKITQNTLPVISSPVIINEDILNNKPTLPNYPIDKNKQTIMVIDDEIDILWFISDIFSKEYNVITISSSLEVESVLRNIHPDIILCDISIPKLDGIELTRIIKSNKQTAHIPLIIISAKQGVEEQIKGMDAGAELYITKPFNVDYLISSVRRLVTRKSVLKEYFTSPMSAYELDEGRLMHNEDKKLIREVQNIIDNNIKNNKLNANFIAKEMNISTRNLYRKLSELESKSISDMIKESRLYIAETLLVQSKKTIEEIIFESGFTNRVSFYNAFSQKHQCTPTEYREKANNISML